MGSLFVQSFTFLISIFDEKVLVVSGHQDIRGNILADKQAKDAAAEVSGKEDIPIEMDDGKK